MSSGIILGLIADDNDKKGDYGTGEKGKISGTVLSVFLNAKFFYINFR